MFLRVTSARRRTRLYSSKVGLLPISAVGILEGVANLVVVARQMDDMETERATRGLRTHRRRSTRLLHQAAVPCATMMPCVGLREVMQEGQSRVCVRRRRGGEMTELDQMRRRGSKTGWVTEYGDTVSATKYLGAE